MENNDNTSYDYLCEKQLRKTDPRLHLRFRSSVFAMDYLLANYKNVFPFYTNHTYEHSEQVIRYCNVIAGEKIIESLTPDEIYILLMSASLHDVGMGVSEADFKRFYPSVPELCDYMEQNPGKPTAEYMREFHQVLSAQFVRKYCALFEIPSEDHIECICRVVRGHRRADLLDRSKYPTDYSLSNGSKVNLAYLSALVKLADELDITSDRNLFFDYSKQNEEWSAEQTMCYKCHGAIKKLAAEENQLTLFYETDDPAVEEEILQKCRSVEKVFSEYRAVVNERTDFACRIQKITFEKI